MIGEIDDSYFFTSLSQHGVRGGGVAKRQMQGYHIREWRIMRSGECRSMWRVYVYARRCITRSLQDLKRVKETKLARWLSSSCWTSECICRVSVCPSNSTQSCPLPPDPEWHDDQRRINGAGKCIWKIQQILNGITRWRSRLVVSRGRVNRSRLWPLRRDDHSGVLIGAGGTRRSDWPARVKANFESARGSSHLAAKFPDLCSWFGLCSRISKLPNAGFELWTTGQPGGTTGRK